MGRPSTYDSVKAAEICRRLAFGESLRKICREDDMPPLTTVIEWNLDNREGFSEQYARARKMQAEVLADELVEICDDGSNDYMQTKHGPVLDAEHVQRSRLRVDTRKWYLSKVLPKIYGDKITQEHTGELSIKRVVTDL